MASEPSTEPEPDLQVDDAVIAAACDRLGIMAEPARPQLHDRLREIASEYLISKSIAPHCRPAKEQKALIERLVQQLDRIERLLHEIAPEYLVTVWLLIDPEQGTPSRTHDLQEFSSSVSRLRDAAELFLEKFTPVPGPPANLPLEGAVRALLPVVEQATGERARWAFNKHKGIQPTLESAEAQAVGILLRGIDGSIRETALVNMLEKMSKQPEQSLSQLDELVRLSWEHEYLRDHRVRTSHR